MEIEKKERSPLFDNYKCLLIFLVVFGHVLEEYGIQGIPGYIRAVIYSFHMPAFIFISGYFSKNVTRCYDRAIKSCLLPFFVFNTIWLILSTGTWKVNVLLPVYVFWYLFSLFFWRISVASVEKLRYPFLLMLLMALYIGCFHEADRFLSASRTVVFFLFFYMGYKMKKEQIYQLRTHSKWLGVLLLAIGIGSTLYFHISGKIPVKTYENLQCYHCSHVGNGVGMGIRLFEMVVSAGMILGLFLIIPDKKYRITDIGSKTITIYLLSSFFILAFRRGMDALGWTAVLQKNDSCLLLTGVVVTIGIVFICSRKWVCEGYRRIFQWLEKMLFVK